MPKKTAEKLPEFVITGSFVYKKKSYNIGEPLPPKMTADEIEQHIVIGAIARVTKDGGVVKRPLPKPTSIDQYLNGPDVAVLQKIRESKPDGATLRAIHQEAKKTGRGQLLIEALSALTGDS